MATKLLIPALLITLILDQIAGKSLDGYVSYYEVFEQTAFAHQRNRRASETRYYHQITIFNRSLVLLLYNDETTVFDIDHVLDVDNNNTTASEFDYLVKGHVMNFANGSRVHGSFIDGRFQGEIAFYGGEHYFVEDAAKFLPANNKSCPLSVAFRLSDIKHKEIEKLCGKFYPPSSEYITPSLHRVVRAAPTLPAKTFPSGKVCGLYIQVDYLLYQEYLKDAQFNDDAAVKQIMAMVHYVVTTVNNIFSNTGFVANKTGKTGLARKLQISIIRTKIFKTAEEFAAKVGVLPSDLNQSMDAVSFLNMASGVNYELFCASYVFTYRYFDGVLGLAWVFAEAHQFISAGACAKYVRTNSNQRPYMRSQNTGIVTFVNYGQRISAAVAAVTFAHELGHTFGADHDNKEGHDRACSPDGTDGNYIMYASATSGDKPNNMRFSDCSKYAIAASLDIISKNPTSLNCLKDVAHFCGNAVVDPGEECDCGFREDCGSDANCCGPADDPNPNVRCRLRKSSTSGLKVQCSSSNGACCDPATCSFIPKSARYFCRPADECRRAAFCNGKSATCPNGTPEPDGKICNEMTKICKTGECTGSICEIIQTINGSIFTSCQAERPVGQLRYNRSELCHLACRSSISGKCFNSALMDSADFNEDFRSFLVNKTKQGRPIQLRAGSPCDNDRGYCDVLQRCRPITADEAPLARLAVLLFSEKTALSLRAWTEQYWWVVTLIGVGIIAFSIGFVKVCAVHTKSDNRALPPARSFADTLRRVSSLGRRNARRTNNPSANQEQPPSAELRRLLANNAIADDDQMPNLPNDTETSQLHSNSPLLQKFAMRNVKRSGRGHVRSLRTRIMHSEYQIPPPMYRMTAISCAYNPSRPQTILESPND